MKTAIQINMRANSKVNGFTLIELMITVAIIGLLTAIAYPSYQGFMTSSNRSAAQADLMALAANLERHKIANFTYGGAASGGADTGKPAIYHTHSPSSEPASNKKYDLYITAVSASGNSFTVEAKPVSGTTQGGDGSLFVFSDGRKGWDKDSNGSLSSSEYCWSC